MQAFVDAQRSRVRRSLFEHTEAILFFGTPFQGMHRWFTDEMPALAKIKNTQVQLSILQLLQQGNEDLRRLRNDFSDMVNDSDRPGIGCFYETKYSNIGKIVERLELDEATDVNREPISLVSKDSAVLEAVRRKSTRLLPCDHFDMNEFGVDDSYFGTVERVLIDIIPESKRSAILHEENSAQRSESTLSMRSGPSTKTPLLLPRKHLKIGDKPPHQLGKCFPTSCSHV